MQGMKEESNKDTEIPENNKPKILKMESSISQIKTLGESVFSRLDQIEDKISRLEDEVDILQQ